MQANVRTLRQPSWVGEFRAFIAHGNVVDLAIGIIIGAAFTGVVGSLVKDVITPVIGLIIGGVDFSNIFRSRKLSDHGFVTVTSPTMPAGIANGRTRSGCARSR